MSLNQPRGLRNSYRGTLGFQFLLAGGFVLLFSVFSVGFLFRELNRSQGTTAWVNEVHSASSQLKFLMRDFYRMRIDFWNYTRVGLERDIILYREDVRVYQSTFDKITAADQGFTGAQPYLTELQDAQKAWLATAEKILKARSASARKVAEEDEMHRKVRTAIESAIKFHDELLSSRETLEKRHQRRSYVILASVNFAVIIGFMFILWNLHSAIVRPIRILTRALENTRSGDLAARVPVTSRNEIGFLQSTFNQMASAIEQMVEDLKKLDAMKSEFMSTVSHELRTPLTSIGGYVKLILSGDVGTIDPTQSEFLQIVDQNVDRLTGLINDLLDVVKLESNRIQLVHEQIDLNEIAKEALASFEVMAKKKGLKISFVPQPGVVLVNVDRRRLTQVVFNLLSNAIKYTEKGKVVMRTQMENLRARLEVEDTGLGIPEEEQAKLFEKFFRAQGALTSREGGTGLGLTIAKGIVEAHGGTIDFKSGKGKGSTFGFWLPSVQAHAAVESREAQGALGFGLPGARTDRRRVRVLIVDAEPSEGATLKSWLMSPSTSLADLDVDVEVAPNLDLVRSSVQGSKSVHAVVLSFSGDQGRFSEIMYEVRSLVGAETPIVALGLPSDVGRAFGQGASAFLTRPLKRSRVEAALMSVMSSARTRVLLVHSNPDVRFLLRRGLEEAGFPVVQADHGDEVFRVLKEETVGVAVFQSDFPELAGADLLRWVRGETLLSDLRVVMITEHEDPVVTKELSSLGAHRTVIASRGIDEILEEVFDEAQRALGRR